MTSAGQSAPDEDDEDDDGSDNDEGPGSRGDRDGGDGEDDDDGDDDSHPPRAARVSTERDAAAAGQALQVQLPGRLGWTLEADFKAVCVISGRDGVVSVNAAEPLHDGSDRHALKQFEKLVARRSGGERKPAADNDHRGSPGGRNGRSSRNARLHAPAVL